MEENHDEQHFTERELAGSHAFATRRDQLFPLAIFEDLCKIIDTAKQSSDRRVHEGGILSVGFDFGTDTKSGSARFWNTHQPAYPELGLQGNQKCHAVIHVPLLILFFLSVVLRTKLVWGFFFNRVFQCMSFPPPFPVRSATPSPGPSEGVAVSIPFFFF